MTNCVLSRPSLGHGFFTGHLLQKLALCLAALLMLAGCASTGSKSITRFGADNLPPTVQGQEVTIMAMHLIDTGYQFGGKNPQAGLDCSGMVSWLYGQAADYKLKGSAKDMASRGRQITPAAVKPGDLIFFNTRGFSYSHVGIYIGDQRFIHAPNSKGKVRIDRLDQGWFATRFEEARTYFD
jgi:cell wall-associated NlpC family hydrolase